jgi:CheY-like chemotaxis protein
VKVLLYIDDNVDELLIFEAACRLGGVDFSVRTIEGSDAGLDYIAGRGRFADRLRYPVPDAALLDIKMIGADGFDVLARIRAEPALARLPVLLFTSSMLPDDARLALDRGADVCLSKPVEMRRTVELARAIDACLQGQGTWRESLAPFAVR